MIKCQCHVVCDRCHTCASPTFFSEEHAQQWVDDRDEDYAEYGQFSKNVPRFSAVYHRIGSSIYCANCTELRIKETRREAAV